MDTFSWSDTFYATLAPCLACLRRPQSPTTDEPDEPQHNHFVRASRSDELEGLLADAPDTENEAETMSLHSNPGQSRRKKRRPKHHKSVTLFGWHLFGRPPIQLPDDDEDDSQFSRRTRVRAERMARTSNTSSSTLDSDAPMLSAEVIESLSPTQVETRARAAEEEERAKEARRARRRQKREMRRMAAALAAGGDNADGAFEGFQGSGGSYPQNLSPSHLRAPTSPSDFSEEAEGYGPFVDGAHRVPTVQPDDEEEEAAADFDGGAYSKRNRGGSASGGSDSRSRTSASRSQSDTSHRSPRFSQQHFISPPPSGHLPHRQEPLVLNLTPATNVVAPERKRSKKSKSSSKSKSSATSASVSSLHTPSAQSPLSPVFAASPKGARFQSSALPDFGIEDGDPNARAKFPSTGLSGAKPPSRKDMSAFLANSGNL